MEELKARNIRPGMVLSIKNNLYRVIEATYSQTCQSEPSMNLRLRNIFTSKLENMHMGAHDSVMREHIVEKEGTFLSAQGEQGTFLDENYEVVEYPLNKVSQREFLTSDCKVLFVLTEDSRVISIDMPAQINVTIASCSSEASGHKKAMTENDVQLTVPGYIKVGDVVRIHSETKEFIERITK